MKEFLFFFFYFSSQSTSMKKNIVKIKPQQAWREISQFSLFLFIFFPGCKKTQERQLTILGQFWLDGHQITTIAHEFCRALHET